MKLQFCLSLLLKLNSTGCFLMTSADHLCPSFSKGNKAKRWQAHSLCTLAGTRISIQKEVSELPPTFLKEWRKKLDLGGGKLLLSPRGLLTQTPSQPRDLHSYFQPQLNSVEPRGAESNNYFIRASEELRAQREHFCSVYRCIKFMHLPFRAR